MTNTPAPPPKVTEERLRELIDIAEAETAEAGYIWAEKPGDKDAHRKALEVCEDNEDALRELLTLRGEVERLREEDEFNGNLIGRLGKILHDTANALKGPPDELAMHSTHDLAAVAQTLSDANNALVNELNDISLAVCSPEFMDPPDYAGPGLAEQVRRMRAELLALRRSHAEVVAKLGQFSLGHLPECDAEEGCTCGMHKHIGLVDDVYALLTTLSPEEPRK